MKSDSSSPAARSAQPAAGVSLVDVRLDGGALLKRVAVGAAEMLVGRGWGEWIGTGRRRYLRLTGSAPLSALHGVRGHGDRTRPVVADQTCRIYADKQLMGAPKSHREFVAS